MIDDINPPMHANSPSLPREVPTVCKHVSFPRLPGQDRVALCASPARTAAKAKPRSLTPPTVVGGGMAGP
jgi:hypothetical protein